MTSGTLHLFLELFTLGAFVAAGFWARARFGADGLWLYGFLFALGGVRENFVILHRVLYGYAELSLMLGRAPAIGAIIWGFSIAAAIAATETIRRRPFRLDRIPRAGELAWAALFMVALAGFFEPFLALVAMARWQEGTATWLDVPKIALVGYPTLASLALVASGWILGRWRAAGPRLAVFVFVTLALAIGHAWGLQRLKTLLGW